MCELLCAVILVFIILSIIAMVVRGDKYESIYAHGGVPTTQCRCMTPCAHKYGMDTLATAPFGYLKNRHDTGYSTMALNKDRAIMKNKKNTNIHRQNLARLNSTPS